MEELEALKQRLAAAAAEATKSGKTEEVRRLKEEFSGKMEILKETIEKEKLERFEQKVLAYMEKLLEDGVNRNVVASNLTGLDSKEAWEIRDRFIKNGAGTLDIVLGLAGCDSERAWKMRGECREAFGQSRLYGVAFVGLAGIDSDEAWKLRDELRKDDRFVDETAISLRGLESERAWRMRDGISGAGLNPEAESLHDANSLMGCDSERAWKKREDILALIKTKRLDGSGVAERALAKSLSGMDSERAWEMRDDLMKQGAPKWSVVEGLAGCDSERAWEMRMELFNASKGDDVLRNLALQSLVGLDSKRAWEMREMIRAEAERSDNDRKIKLLGSVAGSLVGGGTGFFRQLMKSKTK
jgi:hypothetical protein